MHENMEEDIIDSENTENVAIEQLRKELWDLKTLVLRVFKKYHESELNFTLPIKSIDDLTYIEDSFETWSKLTTIALLKVFRKELQKNIENNCDTLEEAIQKLLQNLFDDSFVIHCYWRKSYNPADIYQLEFSNLIACVYISLEKIWPEFTEKQFEYVITNWLQTTKAKFNSSILETGYNI
nr:PREDICTED: uncharacterized protein LOC105668383 isoform X2 [Linepithema humile]XP_012216181.1 PREDICTED: uncharacterized protein LOC105668383 isoform X2 [Linepithema humile]